MRIPKILFSFTRMSDEKLTQFVNQLIIAMTGNANFTSLQADLPPLVLAYNAFVDAEGLAYQGSAAQRAFRNQKKEELKLLLVKLADNVTVLASGNRAKLVSSGFPVTKELPQPRVLVLESFKVMNSKNKGELVTEAKVKAATGFIVQHTADPVTADSIWKMETCSRRKCIIRNLQPGEKRWFKLIATGNRDQVTESEMVMGIGV